MSLHHRQLSGPRWAQARKQALVSAGWRCSRCGHASRLEVHHVEALQHDGEPYASSNLLVLCRSCHIAAHRRPLTEAEQEWRRRLDRFL